MNRQIFIMMLLAGIECGNLNGCFGLSLLTDKAAAAMKDIDQEFDCNQLVGKFEHNTPEMLQTCENMMNSELIRKTKEYMHNLTKERRDGSDGHAFTKKQKVLSRRKRAFGSGCPIFTDDYLTKHAGDIGRRSLSPYTSELHYDPNRFPRVILESKCSCVGCIDPITRRQSFLFSSVPVEVEHGIYHRNDEEDSYKVTTQKFKVACTCVAHSLR